MKALVHSGTNNLFIVGCDDGSIRLCAIKGKRIKDLTGTYNSLAAGDFVDIEPDPSRADRGMILSMFPRRSVFGRFNEKGRATQAIAANIDLVVCVTSPKLPPFRPRFIDRVAVLAEAAYVPLLIVLNKADLGVDEEVEDRLEEYRSLGYDAIRVSAEDGEGLGELTGRLAGKTSVFTGQSGVGKSSLLNRIDPSIDRRTGEVSEKFKRGKHTTTMAVLYPLGDDGTKIIDTPGVRRLALRGIEPDSLVAYFPELAKLASVCAFGLSCTHGDEEGCRISRAVEENDVHYDRYESYLRIRAELEAAVGYIRPGNRDPGRKSRSGPRKPGGGTGARSSMRGIYDEDDE
ncbi:MAG: ribosome small subunit-dependent GTPase A [Rectinemataceae bacterium]|nr:ribosome small subunit-dependent GTPase A [Rectinemataceae bacterium]